MTRQRLLAWALGALGLLGSAPDATAGSFFGPGPYGIPYLYDHPLPYIRCPHCGPLCRLSRQIQSKHAPCAPIPPPPTAGAPVPPPPAAVPVPAPK